jgi:hypothetical protein
MRTPFVLHVLMCAVLIASAGPTFAAPPTGRDAARPIAMKGVEFYEAGRYAEAIEQFERADALFHAPQNGVYIARAQVKLGKLVAARRTYQNIVSEDLSEKTAPAFQEARKTAQEELAALDPRIPMLTIVVNGPLSANARVTIDGNDVSTSALSAAQVDPGEHRVEATAPGAAPALRTVTVGEKENVKIELSVVPSDEPSKPGGSAVPGGLIGTAFAIGGVGLGVGAVFGGLSLAKVNAIKERCDGVHCPRSAAAEGADAARLATVSNIGFIAGAVGMVAGGTLLVLNLRAKPASKGSVPALRAVVGTNSVQLEGVF